MAERRKAIPVSVAGRELLGGELMLDNETKCRLLYRMMVIRAFEEKAEQLYALGKIHGTMHLSIGMEASAVGAVAALRPDDLILSTHRGHGHCIAKGADLGRMMAEFLGKETGYCRGRGGSMHIADLCGGNLGANGVVAGGIPIAVGVGLSLKMQRNRPGLRAALGTENLALDRVVLCFFGDGAANCGAFHEALNMAAIWALPVIFVCENNQYAMSFPTRKAFAVPHIADRAAAYGLPGTTVDGNDLLAVYEAVASAVARARQGEGASLIETITYRWRGHSKSDANRYRTKEEIAAWQARCPIARFSNCLVAEGVLTAVEVEQMRERAYAEIEAAVAFAEASPEPAPETLMEGIYAPPPAMEAE